MIKGGVAHGWLMDTSHEFQLLHRYKPAFCNPMPFEVGEPISHLLETLSIKLLILVQHKNNACPMHANTLLSFCPGMYCEGCKFYVHSVQCPMQLLWSQRLFLSAEEIFFLKATSHWLSWNTKVYVCRVCLSLPRAEQILFWVTLPAVGRVQLHGPEISEVRAKS